MNKEDLEILEELINDTLEAYLDSGYYLTDTYIIRLRNLLKKLGLKEIWDYDKKYGCSNE